MIRRKLLNWLVALALLAPTFALAQSAGILGYGTAPKNGWLPGINPFAASSPINQPINTSYAVVTASISGTTLTTTASTGSRGLQVGDTVTAIGGTALTSGTVITANIDANDWTVNHSQTVTSEQMSGVLYAPFVASSNIAISSLTAVGNVATATVASTASIVSGVTNVVISGASQALYNRSTIPTVISSTQFTYTMSGSPTSPATGTPVYGTPGWPTPNGSNYYQAGQVPINVPLATDPIVNVTVQGSWGQPVNSTVQVTAGVTGSSGDVDQHLIVVNNTSANFTGALNGAGMLTVSGINSGGQIANGQAVTIPSVGTRYITQLSSPTCSCSLTGVGGNGTYGITGSDTITATAMTSAGTTYHDYENFVRTSNTTATATSQASCDVNNSTGLGPQSGGPFIGCGTTAIGSAVLAGMIVQQEIASGVISHKIQIALLASLCRAGAGPLAILSDCSQVSGMQEGVVLAIPPNVACPTALSPYGSIVCTALKTYGAFTDDQAGANNTRFDAAIIAGSALSAYSEDFGIIFQLLQQVQ